MDSENLSEPIKYPIAVIFVLISKSFEAFSANGIRSVLALYLRDSLKLTEELSTTVLHVFNFISQFLPILGAVLADSYLGNARTIFYFCIPYALGYFGLFLATLPIEIATHAFLYITLMLIAIGNGSLRACITSLGGHQFKLPEQKADLDRYFSVYYLVYYVGILLSKVVPPEVRVSVHCFGRQSCYTAVFGMIAVVFLISWSFFLIGLFFYKKETPNRENVLLKVFGCVSHAAHQKIKGNSRGIPWIRGAIGKYSEPFVNDVSIFLKLVKLFMPLPIYYALLAQIDSTWTFQATQLNTTFGSIYIQADQFKALGPILLLIQIPLWQRVILPLMQRFNFNLTTLESVAIGGLCAAFSFVCAGFLQQSIDINRSNPPSVMWQFPQFFLIMMGEVLLSIPGLKFSYTHAPKSMKSVLTAFFFINNAMGNLIVVIITTVQPLQNQSHEYFFYATLMFIGIVIFTMLAAQYDGVEIQQYSDERVIESFISVNDIHGNNMDENYIDDSENSEMEMIENEEHQSQILVNSLSTEKDNEFDLLPFLKKISFDILCSTSLGTEMTDYSQNSLYHDIFTAFETTEEAMNRKFQIPFLYPQTIYKLTKLYKNERKSQRKLLQFQRDILERRRNVLRTQGGKNSENDDMVERNILIDHILLNEDKFTDQQINDHVVTFVSGYETWANALAHTMLLIAIHPEVQEKCFDEINSVFSSKDIEIDSVSMNQLQYLDMVQKEVYRLMPTVPIVLRQTTEDFELEKGLVIPKNVNFLINLYAMHRRKDIWGEDADKFNPDNFLPENANKRHPFSFIPFSGGQRNCIATSFKMSLSFDRILMDAIVLTNNIKRNEALADKVADDAELSYLELESMQQFHEQYNKLNLIARERTDKDIIYQDDSQIRELQLENRELKTCIDEHKKVIELIMHKYREKTNNKIAETKLDFERLAKLHENAKCTDIINKQGLMLNESAAVMKKAIALDEEETLFYVEQLSRLETENRGLRELLCIAHSSNSILLMEKDMDKEKGAIEDVKEEVNLN
ncbi:unnamed protein product [Diamesa hyperborea]